MSSTPFRYLVNLRSEDALPLGCPSDLSLSSPDLTKEDRREWASHIDTDHCFYSLASGVIPGRRIRIDNPVSRITGLVVDYDAPAPEDFTGSLADNRRVRVLPTYAHRTPSGNFRLLWLFEEPLPVDEAYAKQFLTELTVALKCPALYAGYDSCSENPGQYYDAGTCWELTGGRLDPTIVTAALFKAVGKRRVQTDLNIPMDVVEAECLKRWPSRLTSLKVGERVPLFWIDDGVERIGGSVTEDGIVCYSERAESGFVNWHSILGAAFVSEYETKKVGDAVRDVWYDGKRYYRFTRYGLFDFPKEDLVMELRASGLGAERKKGQRISEVESALLFIQAQNRVHGVAPVLHEKAKVVNIGGQILLNSSRCKPVEPAAAATGRDFPFLRGFFETFLDAPSGEDPTSHLFAWMQRSYEAMHYGKLLQGQAVILVGPTGRGKSLFSNQILAGLLGGVATASDYLQARSQFNKELAENPVWAIDDTTSAASAADHRKFTELLKARIASPYIESQAKYVDSQRIPHAGRVVITLNEDAQSLSVVPALDVSNSDKILGFRISPDHRPVFPPNHELEEIIARELPFFARWLLDWAPPESVMGSARYGVLPYVHPFVRNAAVDNGSRAPALEAIELFAKVHRNACGHTRWQGTATELRSLFCDYSDLSGLAFGRDHYTLARGLAGAEEMFRSGVGHARPVTSESRGKGKRFTIDLSPEYDDTDD